MDDLKDLETPAGAGGSSGNMGASGAGGQGRGGTSGLQYSIPGILHFLQHEWARFEMERGQWEVEKAELQVKSSRPVLSYINVGRLRLSKLLS